VGNELKKVCMSVLCRSVGKGLQQGGRKPAPSCLGPAALTLPPLPRGPEARP
jgi:hypothetical protein